MTEHGHPDEHHLDHTSKTTDPRRASSGTAPTQAGTNQAQ